MAFTLDPEIGAVLAQQAEAAVASGFVPPARGDVLGLRALVEVSLEATFARLPDTPDVSTAEHATSADDGAEIGLRWYTHAETAPGSAVVYVHGGGMISGTLATYDRLVRHYVQRSGVPFLAVGYRRAPEHPGTGPARDTFAAIRWMSREATEMGVDADRIAVMGDSGGGGIGAGAAILARDHDVALRKQILIYPMLDDRNTVPDPLLAPTATWSYDNNHTAWSAVLGDDRGGANVSPVAAPARLTDFEGLAPAYIEVGELDIFRDESIEYASHLLRAGVSCELHVHPGGPHAHDWLNAAAAVSQRALADRVRILTAL